MSLLNYNTQNPPATMDSGQTSHTAPAPELCFKQEASNFPMESALFDTDLEVGGMNGRFIVNCFIGLALLSNWQQASEVSKLTFNAGFRTFYVHNR